MIHTFIDTNIIIDLIADRKPFSKFAIEIFGAAENKKVKLYTSSHTIATTHYILKKYMEEKLLRNTLQQLLDYIKVISVDISILQKSLRSNHKDFEDAIQIISASGVSAIAYIITRNIKDFKGSEIPAIAPDEFCGLL